ncbi:MAG: chalcone isomerase family protein [Rubrivivax sp.]|jgi:hypothetical protein|nr:chalcone isomerase family protein [Rubrivivax sp.]
MTRPVPVSRRRALALLPAAALAPLAADAASPPPEVAAELPGARLQGSGRLRFLGLSVYDARLWAPSEGTLAPATWPRSPLALELVYQRSLDGDAIAERSLDEMRRQAEIPSDRGTAWLDAMRRAFPDVRQGDRLTGVKRPGRSARFFANGRLTAEVEDADFARLFFGIWLSEKTSQPALRDALLGAQRPGTGA